MADTVPRAPTLSMSPIATDAPHSASSHAVARPIPDAAPVFGDPRRRYDHVLADAGVGVALRGRVYDRDVTLRADFPIWVRSLYNETDEFGFRFRLSARDLF